MKDHDDTLTMLRTILEEMFEVDPGAVQPDALLYEDLDIDSIDAVDLVVRLKEITGKKVSPDDFQEVKTVSDVVEAVDRLLEQ